MLLTNILLYSGVFENMHEVCMWRYCFLTQMHKWCWEKIVKYHLNVVFETIFALNSH